MSVHFVYDSIVASFEDGDSRIVVTSVLPWRILSRRGVRVSPGLSFWEAVWALSNYLDFSEDLIEVSTSYTSRDCAPSSLPWKVASFLLKFGE